MTTTPCADCALTAPRFCLAHTCPDCGRESRDPAHIERGVGCDE